MQSKRFCSTNSQSHPLGHPAYDVGLGTYSCGTILLLPLLITELCSIFDMEKTGKMARSTTTGESVKLLHPTQSPAHTHIH